MDLEAFLGRLQGVRKTGGEQYVALCPAHGDRSASLAVKSGERGILLYCRSHGCTREEITKALGLTVRDLLFRPGDFTPPASPPTQKQFDEDFLRFYLGSYYRPPMKGG